MTFTIQTGKISGAEIEVEPTGWPNPQLVSMSVKQSNDLTTYAQLSAEEAIEVGNALTTAGEIVRREKADQEFQAEVQNLGYQISGTLDMMKNLVDNHLAQISNNILQQTVNVNVQEE